MLDINELAELSKYRKKQADEEKKQDNPPPPPTPQAPPRPDPFGHNKINEYAEPKPSPFGVKPDPFNTQGPPKSSASDFGVEEIKTLKGSILEDAISFLLEHFPAVVATNTIVIAAAYGLAILITAPAVGILHGLFRGSPLILMAAPIIAFTVPAILLVGKLWFCEALTAVMVARRQYNRQGGGSGSVDLCFERIGAIFSAGVAQIICLWGGSCLAGIGLVVGAMILPSFLLWIGMFGIFCFIIYLQTNWCLTGIVAALEDKWAFDSLKRSTHLVEPDFWSVLGYRFLFGLIGSIGVWGFNVMVVSMIGEKPEGALLIGTAAAKVFTEAIAISLFSAGMACAYHHLEARRPAKQREVI